MSASQDGIGIYGELRKHPTDEIRRGVKKVLENIYGRNKSLPTVKIQLPYLPPELDPLNDKNNNSAQK